MRGVPLKVAQELLGHATMDMTRRDAPLSPNVPREAVRPWTAVPWYPRGTTGKTSDTTAEVAGAQ
jgi:hypothetical protein